jgi:hypothetical protein
MSVRVTGAEDAYRAGVTDAIIIPAVAILLAIKVVLKAVIAILMRILDFSFPLLMELIRFPLFTIRVFGDGIIATVQRIVTWLPVAEENRRKWSQLIGRKWSALRERISYKAFEQAVHHAFEHGMERVFARCRNLSPRTALYVIVAAVLWLPISLALATAMHAFLLVYAALLPAWMQLLHPLATVIAKSKLLVLPVYPAAWPQAKRHPTVQAIGSGCRNFAGLYFVQKAACRYRQAEQTLDSMLLGLRRFAAQVGLQSAGENVSRRAAETAALIRKALRQAFELLSPVPVIGPVLKQYGSHYGNVKRGPGNTSARLTTVWERWSIKFSADYYEAKERAKAETAVETRCASTADIPRRIAG